MGDHHASTGAPEPELARPVGSHVRYKVVAIAVALAGITYLDRVCIAQTAPLMMHDLSLSETQMANVFSAFTLAYALFEIPSGAWGDRIGARRLLTRIVVWWSCFTIATAAAFHYASLLIIRFLFGMGEAGAFPNVSKTFSRWLPLTERGTAQGIFFAGAHLGGGLTGLLVTVSLWVMPWRMVFVVFGAVGFVWAAAWYRWFRDEPAEHPEVSPGELKLIQAGRVIERHPRLDRAAVMHILASRNMIALCLMYFPQAYGFYFNITWLPTYLKVARGFSSVQLGLLSGLPLILSAAADLVGGVATDRAVRAFGVRVGRCGIGIASLLIAAVGIVAGAAVEDPLLSAVLIALSCAADSFLLGAAWSVCIDASGPHAGLVTGTMNTAGQIGAFLSPIVLAYLLKGKDQANYQEWFLPLFIMGVLYFAGALCWLFIDPRRPIVAVSADDRA